MTGITRRSLLVGAAATLGSGIGRADDRDLASIAASKGLKFGSLVRLRPSSVDVGVLTDPDYKRMVTSSCNLYVTISLFWKTVSAVQHAPADYSAGDEAAAWARANAM